MNFFSISMSDQKSIQIANKPSLLEQAGRAANQAASRRVFDEYRRGKAENTKRAQDANLTLFAAFLMGKLGIPVPGELCCEPEAWTGITWGLVEAFKLHLLQQGYAIASVNLALSNVKVYAKLASKAGSLDKLEYLQIKDVTGYSRKESKNINKARPVTRRPGGKNTGKSAKKGEHTVIPADDAKRLKNDHENTPQGRRDSLLMCLLLDLGLRCGEASLLKVSDVNLEAGQITFHRPKVDKVQTHDMPGDLLRAMKRYFAAGDVSSDPEAPLLRSSKKSGELTSTGMAERSITQRVKVLGQQLGIERLSAHDCRHFWATTQARRGIDTFRLQEAGGWTSLAMPRRYVEEAQIANEGMESV